MNQAGRNERWRAVWAIVLVAAGSVAAAGQYRTLDDRFAPPAFTTREAWAQRAAELREHMLASAGLLPLPDKTPLAPVVFGETGARITASRRCTSRACRDFSSPAICTGRPATGRFPRSSRRTGTGRTAGSKTPAIASVPGPRDQPRAPGLRRVHLRHDRLQRQPAARRTTFGGPREKLWGLSIAGLQLWNGIRALDFLESLPYVRRDAHRRDRRVRRRHAGVSARRGRRARAVAAPGQHDLAAHAGRLPVREPARACGSTPTTSRSPRRSRRGRC